MADVFNAEMGNTDRKDWQDAQGDFNDFSDVEDDFADEGSEVDPETKTPVIQTDDQGDDQGTTDFQASGGNDEDGDEDADEDGPESSDEEEMEDDAPVPDFALGDVKCFKMDPGTYTLGASIAPAGSTVYQIVPPGVVLPGRGSTPEEFRAFREMLDAHDHNPEHKAGHWTAKTGESYNSAISVSVIFEILVTAMSKNAGTMSNVGHSAADAVVGWYLVVPLGVGDPGNGQVHILTARRTGNKVVLCQLSKQRMNSHYPASGVPSEIQTRFVANGGPVTFNTLCDPRLPVATRVVTRGDTTYVAPLCDSASAKRMAEARQADNRKKAQAVSASKGGSKAPVQKKKEVSVVAAGMTTDGDDTVMGQLEAVKVASQGEKPTDVIKPKKTSAKKPETKAVKRPAPKAPAKDPKRKRTSGSGKIFFRIDAPIVKAMGAKSPPLAMYMKTPLAALMQMVSPDATSTVDFIRAFRGDDINGIPPIKVAAFYAALIQALVTTDPGSVTTSNRVSTVEGMTVEEIQRDFPECLDEMTEVVEVKGEGNMEVVNEGAIGLFKFLMRVPLSEKPFSSMVSSDMVNSVVGAASTSAAALKHTDMVPYKLMMTVCSLRAVLGQ